jgi:hypothetical protein
MDSDCYYSTPSSPTSNLDPSSIPMDQLPASAATQPEIPSIYTPDPVSDTMDWLAAVEGSLASIQQMLEQLLPNNQNLPSAPPLLFQLWRWVQTFQPSSQPQNRSSGRTPSHL